MPTHEQLNLVANLDDDDHNSFRKQTRCLVQSSHGTAAGWRGQRLLLPHRRSVSKGLRSLQTCQEDLPVMFPRYSLMRCNTIGQRFFAAELCWVACCPRVARPPEVDEHEIGICGNGTVHDALPHIDVHEPRVAVYCACRLLLLVDDLHSTDNILMQSDCSS